MARAAVYIRESAPRLGWLEVYADTGKLPAGRTPIEAALAAWGLSHALSLTTPPAEAARVLDRVHARWRVSEGLPVSLPQFCAISGKADSTVRTMIKEGRLTAHRVQPRENLHTAAGRPSEVWIKATEVVRWQKASA